MNVVIYTRFSSHKQSEQSTVGQLEACKIFAERHNYNVIGEYNDEATTGTNDNRPEFKRMIEDSAKGNFEGIIVYQLDRFARNRYDSAINKAKLKKNGVRVFSARENISDDASGILMESVLEGMAEYFSVELGQKTKRGMNLNAEKCYYNGSKVPLGLKLVEADRIERIGSKPIIKKKYAIDENIITIANKVAKLAEKELDNTNIKRLYKLLRESEKQKFNLLDKVKLCDNDNVAKAIFEEIGKMDNEQNAIKNQIIEEEAHIVKIEEPEIIHFLTALQKGDASDEKYCRMIIKVLINKIYLYDDRFTIIFNTQDKDVTISLDLVKDIELTHMNATGSPICTKTGNACFSLKVY